MGLRSRIHITDRKIFCISVKSTYNINYSEILNTEKNLYLEFTNKKVYIHALEDWI